MVPLRENMLACKFELESQNNCAFISLSIAKVYKSLLLLTLRSCNFKQSRN